MADHDTHDHTGVPGVGVGDATTHIADATDAHDASAVSFDATGLSNTAATEVQSAIEDLDAAIGASGIPATILDAKGDLIAASAADTAAKLTAGANGTVLMAASGQATGLRWTNGLYTSQRLMAIGPAAADETYNLNTTSYSGPVSGQFYHDWDAFPATHFRITGYLRSSESGQTVTAQLTPLASLTNPVSAGGDDLAIGFNGGAPTNVSSGWVAVSDSMSGVVVMVVAIKGSNATVDLVGRWMDIAFKIV